MDVDGMANHWPLDTSLENFTDTDISEMLSDDKDLQQLIADMEGGGSTLSLNNQNMLLGSVDGFDQQSFSASDSSLADQYSPPFSAAGQYNDQYSPSTGSIDSGLPNDIGDSPLLSPDTLSVDYPSPVPDSQNLDQMIGNVDNQISPMLLKLIQHQVQQALIQQQHQQQQQQQHQQMQQEQQQDEQQLELQQNYQQRMTLLAQQRNSQLIQQSIQASKNDSQLRKMLTQTKNNITQTKNTIMHTLQDKKEKIQRVFPKGNIKPGKRKITIPQEGVKVEKVQALSQGQDSIIISNGGKEIPVSAESLQALLQQSKSAVPASNFLQLPVSIDSSIAPVSCRPTQQNSFVTQPTTATATISNPSLSANSNTGGHNAIKLSIDRVNKSSHSSSHSHSHHHSSKAHKLKKLEAKRAKQEAKKSRVEHVIIEKRYRMKITDSLNELKGMLPGSDEKKATKNSILQAAIEEIKRLKKQNETLRRRFEKMKSVFDELRNIGILSQSQCCITSSSSDSNISDECTTSENTSSDSTNKSVEPEVNQDHYASPFQRQSARDGAKVMTCFALFAFLIFNPLNLLAGKPHDQPGTSFSSRHLLGIRDASDASPQFSLFSTLINIFMSLFILMIMLMRGNPKCQRNSKLTQCFKSQFRKAQKKINKHDYEDAKASLRIALFVIGNSCPKTFHGMLASFSWKCVCHMLYQLGILTALEAVGNSILPAAISLKHDKDERQFAAKLSAKAYKKLHEISLKDNSSTYMESACYIMNAIYCAEVSCDKEMLCTLYATAVIHMRERLISLIAPFPEYYFTACAHHASLASKDGVFAVDWIFENRGYEFFNSSLWDINRPTVFNATDDDSKLDENDLLQIVFVQFQEHLLSKALKRIIVPDSFYPNEGKIELRQRSISFLESLGTGPVSEQIDPISLHYQSLYFWWGFTLKQLLNVSKEQRIEDGEFKAIREIFEEIPLQHRHPLVSLAEAVISNYIYIRNMKYLMETSKEIPHDVQERQIEIQEQLESAAVMIDNMKQNIELNVGEISSNQEIEELVFIMCCGLMIESHYLLWQYDSRNMSTEQELSSLINENSVLHSFAVKYPELTTKVQLYEQEIQCMSGSNPSEINRTLKKTQHIKSLSCQDNPIRGFYMQSNEVQLINT